MANVLVTGATGFNGYHVVRLLSANGYDVACLVRRTSDCDRLQPFTRRLIVCDVCDGESVRRALSDHRVVLVFHLAGLTKTLRANLQRINVDGVRNVAASCAERSNGAYMNKKLPYRASAGLTRDQVDRRVTLRRAIRTLCDVSQFKLKERRCFSEDETEHVCVMLDELTVQLLELTKIKETDGFFEEILTKAPERRHTVDQIMEDYDRLLIDLEEMKSQLDSGHAPHVACTDG